MVVPIPKELADSVSTIAKELASLLLSRGATEEQIRNLFLQFRNTTASWDLQKTQMDVELRKALDAKFGPA
jgi:hypothetical protein